jgi:hypothetical protein
MMQNPRLGNSLTGPKNNQKQILVKTCQIRQKTMKFQTFYKIFPYFSIFLAKNIETESKIIKIKILNLK